MKLSRYEKYDMAFETIVNCITDCRLSKVGEVNKALAKINGLVEKEAPMNVEYNHVARNYRDELEYEDPNCPECGLELELNEEYSYCPYCGQRLDWNPEIYKEEYDD